MSDLAYTNLTTPVNQKSGIAEFALLALAAWFAPGGIQAPVAPFTLPGDSITIKTPHVFNPLLTSKPMLTKAITTAGAGYANGTYPGVPLVTLTGTGTGAIATITVALGDITVVNITNGGTGYTAADTFTVAPMFDAVGAGSGFVGTVSTVGPVATYSFIKFQLAPQKNKLEIKTKGDLGSNGQASDLEIFITGSYVQAHDKIKNLLNQRLIVLVKDANCPADMYYQLGCDCQFAYLTGDFTTATTKDGAKGYTIKITYDDGPQFYAPQAAGVQIDPVVLPG